MMAIKLLVCFLIAGVSAAPLINTDIKDWHQELVDNLELDNLQELYRLKRSNYGNLYMTPCAAAAASAPAQQYIATSYPSQQIPAYGSPASAAYAHAAYNNMVQAQKGHPSSYPYSYGRPYYRSVDQFEDDQEVMGFSDSDQALLEHRPTARYGAISGATGGAAPTSGPMVGVFPNANTGGCNVPLLVSCSPSIVHGRIMKTQPYYDYNSSPPAASQPNLYRVVDDHSLEGSDGYHEKAPLSSEHNIARHESKSSTEKHQ